MKYILTWEVFYENIEMHNTLKEAELRAKDLLADCCGGSVTISKCVKKYTNKIVEEKLDD